MMRPTPPEIIARCDDINRTRPLTDAEVDQLEHALKLQACEAYRVAKKGQIKPSWSPTEDDEVRRALTGGATCKDAGKLVGRSEHAVHARLRVMPNPPERKKYAR